MIINKMCLFVMCEMSVINEVNIFNVPIPHSEVHEIFFLVVSCPPLYRLPTKEKKKKKSINHHVHFY